MVYSRNAEQAQSIPSGDFFTVGAGNQSTSINDYMPENNLDLSSNKTWNTAPLEPEIPANVVFSAENMPNTSDATIVANLPPNEKTLPPQGTASSSLARYSLSMSGDKISPATTTKIADMVSNFRYGNENAATFYDEIRSAAESFRSNSFGAKK